ncbi:MAG: serine hydrolase, partial [Proteobacteria bacterium]|nr:serine hydrolase [Pseudomonadota bacterium]
MTDLDPRGAGMAPDRLARISDHLMERYIKPGKIAGALPMVFRKGKLAYCEALGSMDLERGKPMRDDTIFRIYSMTKPITSVAIMMLYERGHFQLSDPVWRFIPEWRDLQVYQAGVAPNFMSQAPLRAMTIRDLLTHMSGLTYGFMNRTNVDHAYRRLGVSGAAPGERADNAAENLEEMVERLSRIPLEFSPGTRWNYSVSTDILGYLVEVISGQRFDAFLKQHIFDPLGMTDTGFVVAPRDVPRFAANYQRSKDKSLMCIDDPEDSIYIRPRSMLSGGGGLASTAGDYLKFTRMLLNGGELAGARILGRKTIEMMTCNFLPDNEDLTRWALGTFSETANEGYGFGLGFSINLGTARTCTIGSAGEYAWGGAASTIFWVDPAE